MGTPASGGIEDPKSIERAFAVNHRFLPDRLQSRNDRDKLSISFQRFEEVPMPTKVAPLPARAAPRKTKAPGIVSSSHLVSAKSVELSELEFGLIVAWNAFSRWAVRCMAAAGCPELTITDVLVLHHICHRARNKKVGDICFVLNVEDTHVVAYSLKKLLAADLAQGEKIGKEVFYSPTAAGETAVAKYREVRETCLIANLDAERNADIGESARLLRTMSGLYDQAARAATSL
jgi:predicted MarR family transcription regulator